MTLRTLARCFSALTLVFGVAGCSSHAKSDSSESNDTEVDRPPQFVLLAFDGSLSLPFWEESRAFARDNGVKFTYFMSGVYFLADAKKASARVPEVDHALYFGPHGHGLGHSDIGFGGPASDIPLRVQQVIDARAEGHEMGSHANGHFDGTTWTQDDWTDEFAQFDALIFKTSDTSGVATPDLGFTPADVAGFRAPLLGQGPALYKALAAKKFLYDTSKTNATNYWPQKLDGIWNFPLAEVRIAGLGKRTLSMDYNFYFAQSGGQPDPAHKDEFKQQMLDTYMAYFNGNYFGNRAPVSIGHHFSKWNGGAYWEALQTFAKAVCGMPEVKCVTYSELVAFMEAHQDQRDVFMRGAFPHMPAPSDAAPAGPILQPTPNDPAAWRAAGLVPDVAEAHFDDSAQAPGKQ